MTGRLTALWTVIQTAVTKQMKLPITYDYNDYGTERFIYNFTFYDFFNDKGHLKDKCFVAVKPE